MMITPRNYDEVFTRTKTRMPGKLQRVLDEFVQSGYYCVEVENYPQKTAVTACESFRSAIKRYGMLHVHVHMSGDKLYLVNDLAKKTMKL